MKSFFAQIENVRNQWIILEKSYGFRNKNIAASHGFSTLFFIHKCGF